MDFLSCFDFKKQTSLYIHIPFCFSKCSYCAFYSKAGCSEKDFAAYTDKICSEIDAVVSKMDRPFYTAFIGGGNPFCLSAMQLERICKAVCKKGRPEEFTCEMNPESLSKEYFPLFKKYLTRLSMGIQSLDEKALSFLGRNCSLEQEIRGIEQVKKLREETGASINFDIICCLPNGHDSSDDIRKVYEMAEPDHISLYALSIEEGTALYKKGVTPMDNDTESVELKKLWKILSDYGYSHYEVSNFAKPGKESLHNTVYWDYEQYVGLGCAAASTGFKDGKTYRCENQKSIENYLKSDSFATYTVTEISDEEAEEELIMLGLRHKKGLSLERLEKIRGSKISTIPPEFKIINNYIVPTEEGLLVADAAALSVDSTLHTL
ncbi:MAG: radical SAM family heme chaperone HemW [Sphaerochaetaceae bacterium]|nr:radical SAM family heme chaperone HemW [Sphaerochaetaceae bacterium]